MLLFLVHFLECLLLLLVDYVDEETERIIFKLRKFSRSALLRFCLIFWQFQPGAAYKSVAYKKTVQLKTALLDKDYLKNYFEWR